MDNEIPFAIRMNQTIDILAETISNSGLPACVLRYIIRDFNSQLDKMAEAELAHAMQGEKTADEEERKTREE